MLTLQLTRRPDTLMRKANPSGPGHEKLKGVWDAKKNDLGLTQEIAAEKLGFSSQGTVGDYLRGRIPLNLKTAIKFARLLESPLSDVWDGDAERC